jgi:hypothetical protein
MGIPLAAWYRGPFLSLLRRDLARGIQVVNRMLERGARRHVEVLRDLSRYPRKDAAQDEEESGISLDLLGYGVHLYIGDAHVWCWYRGSSVGPYPCMSALFSLEMRLDELVKAGVLVPTVASWMLRDATTLASTGLTYGFLVRHIEQVIDELDDFLSVAEVWELEFSRTVSEGQLHVQGADPPERIGRERRLWTPREVAMQLVEEWVEFTIPQIIEIELFEATHGQLRRNQARATRNGKVPYLLGGGRLCCIRCSSTMTGYRLKSGSRRYKCAGMTRIDVSERCYATTKAEPLEDLVWAVVKRMLENPKLVAAEVGLKHASNDEKRAELQMEIEARDRALAECNRQEKRLLEVYVADEAMELKDLLGAHHREINTRRQQLRTEQRDLRQQLDDLHQDDARADALVVFCERVRKKLHTFTFEEKRQALDEFNLQAIWGAGEKLKIRVDVPKQVLQQLGDDVFADIALRWNGTCNN